MSLKPLIHLYEQEYSRRIEKLRGVNAVSPYVTDLPNDDETLEDIYNDIACTWLSNNPQVYDPESYHRWFEPLSEIEIEIGGIYPQPNAGQEYNGIDTVLVMAQNDFMRGSIKKFFPNYKIKIMNFTSECKPDLVLRQFISFYSHRTNLIGVLGPACSEAIEPIAAISKHYKLSVITYSAEGISFENRENYPYFYRTIGENRQ